MFLAKSGKIKCHPTPPMNTCPCALVTRAPLPWLDRGWTAAGQASE